MVVLRSESSRSGNDDDSEFELPFLRVGAVCRAKRRLGNSSWFSSRAVVATVDPEEKVVSLIYEGLEPRSLRLPRRDDDRGRGGGFLVCPRGDGGDDEDHYSRGANRDFTAVKEREEEDEEDDVPFTSLSSLLPFEPESCESTVGLADRERGEDVESDESDDVSASRCKENGDALFRSRDYTSAIAWYETALDRTSTSPKVGDTVVLKRGGRTILADVYCVENDEDLSNTTTTLLDVGYRRRGDDEETEETVRSSEIVLRVAPTADDRELQSRILLNLSRCLLRLADIAATCSSTASPTTIKHYRTGAVLACSTVIACSRAFRERRGAVADTDEPRAEDFDWEVQETKARYVRANAYADLRRHEHAAMDLKILLRDFDPNHKDALRLRKVLERETLVRKKTDKRLVKDVCRWVDECASNATRVDDGSSSTVSSSAKTFDEGRAISVEKIQTETTLSNPAIVIVAVTAVALSFLLFN